MHYYISLKFFIFILLLNFSFSKFYKFEYVYSFKYPIIHEGTRIPFWNHTGDVILSDEFVRISNSIPSQSGMIVQKNKNTFKWWKVEFDVKITNNNKLGAEGIAFWFTDIPVQSGPVFGAGGTWNGLAVMLDTYDNDGHHNNPYVYVVVNDGTFTYDPNKDGDGMGLGGCLKRFRNTHYPVRIQVEYFMDELIVFISPGLSEVLSHEHCFSKVNVSLPSSGYFAMTSSTGELADNHDVYRFLSYSITSEEKQSSLDNDSEDEYSHEYIKMQEKTSKERERYLSEHPDKKPQPAGSVDETDSIEIKYMYDTLAYIVQHLKASKSEHEQTINKLEQLSKQINSQTSSQKSSVDESALVNVEIENIGRQVDRSFERLEWLISAWKESQKSATEDKQWRTMLQSVHREIQLSNRALASLQQRTTEFTCVSPIFLFFCVFVSTVTIILVILYLDRRQNQYKKYF